MKLQRLLVVLTGVNLGLLLFLLAQIRPVGAQQVAPVLRARALEIVDEKGTVRADLSVFEPDTAILHMRDEHGRIRVKLDANSDGSGFSLMNDSQEPGIWMAARPMGSGITWTDNTRRAHTLQPN